jgi:tetratricopeptide (TPR) repeat protein
MRAIAAVVLCTALCRAGWVKLETRDTDLYSDAGERTARPILNRFEQIRQVFQKAGIQTGPLRLRVFLFASPDEYRQYRDGSDGFYQSAPERDYIAMHAGPDASRVAFHEYVHLVLRHSLAPLPRWFDEGASEFYSTMQIRKDGILIGDPIPAHLQRLLKEPWLDAVALNQVDRGPMFYAESWALVHMLNLSPRWRDAVPRFFALIADQKPVDDAFREAFGRTIDQALLELRGYLNQLRPSTLPITIAAVDAPHLSAMSAREAAIACAELALAAKRPELAAKLVEKFAPDAEIEAARGAIALAAGQRDEARAHFDRAITAGSRDPSLYFEYAGLERDRGRSDTALLEKAIQLDPDFADAHFLLGVRDTDDKKFAAALEHLRAATRGHPDRSSYWHALAYAEILAGNAELALPTVRRAMLSAETESERRAAEALLGLDQPHTPPKLAASVITPRSWDGLPADARIEGTLIEFDCSGPSIRVRDDAGNIATLKISRPSEIRLIHAPERTLQFSCGPQNMRVFVDYNAASQEVSGIEFRL